MKRPRKRRAAQGSEFLAKSRDELRFQMSYDFHLFRRIAGEDSLTTARAQGEESEDSGLPDADAERVKSKVAAALIAQNPVLEVFEFDHAEIARSLSVSVDEARRLYRHVELNGPENGNGVQVTLFDHSASITVPYWHLNSTTARKAMAEIWGYLQTINREAGFLIYDPQLDRLLDLSQDYEAVISAYLETARYLR